LDSGIALRQQGGFAFGGERPSPSFLQILLTRHFLQTRKGAMKAKDLVVRLFDIVGGVNKNTVDIRLGLDNELDVTVHVIKSDESSEPI
jgi:hypothetical protein